MSSYPATKSTDQVIEEIAETLRHLDGSFVQAIANMVLENQVIYKGDSTFDYYTCVDLVTGTFSREVEPRVFQFYEGTTPKKIVDLNEMDEDTIETCINLFRYTLFDNRPGVRNIHSLYGDDADRYIAGCFMASDLGYR